MAGLLDFIQGASNAAASNVSAPVDGLAWLLRKAGIPIPDAPVGGSDWMEQKGFTRPAQGVGGLLGESVGGVLPIVAAAKAPQIAGGLLAMERNAMAPKTLNPQTGAIVWHGSPHKFSKFDSSKIGTGEGAQAYGHGLYLAESPDVAASYMRPAGRTSTTIDGKNAIDAAYSDRSIQRSVRYLQDHETPEQAMKWAIEDGKPEIAKQIDELVKNGRLKITDHGNMFKVDLPDEHIAKMLDWDKPLSQQPKEVQAWLQDPYNAYRAKLTAKDVGGNEPTGSLVMNRLQELMSEGKRADAFTNQANFGAANASRELKDYGIPGIRYFDGGSRGTGQGTSNFVVFPGNENLLQILERNGQPMNGLLGP